MAQRRFGPTKAAGVVVIEKQAQASIQSAALGVTAYSGIMQKGPIGKIFRARTRSEFEMRAGGLISESLLPDVAFDFYRSGRGAGELWLNRITDGNEKAAKLAVMNRRHPKAAAMELRAGNAGRWGGKKALYVDQFASITATTLQMASVPASLKEDELAGAIVRFSAVSGKSFKVESNNKTGLLTFASDINLVAELNGSANHLYSAQLLNDGDSMAVLFHEGTSNPGTEWGMDLYFIQGGVAELAKRYDNMSSDPSKANYFLKVINDDPLADYLVKASDLYSGSISADIRPANIAGQSLLLTASTLKAKIVDETVSSAALASAKADALSLGASIMEDQVTLECTAAGARASQVLTFGALPAANDSVSINGYQMVFKAVPSAANEVLLGASAEACLDNLLAFIQASQNAALKNVVLVKKSSVSTMTVYAQNAGVAGNSIATVSAGGDNKPTFGAATLAGGSAQTWSYASQKMPFLAGLVVTTGVAFASPNEYGCGFTLKDITSDPDKSFAAEDVIILRISPLEVNMLAGGFVYPKASLYRNKFPIESNTADTITVRAGYDMTGVAAVGDDFRVEYRQELGGGYDGIAEISDATYELAYDPTVSPLKNLRGKNLGLVKLATPGVTSAAVQKAGAAFAESQNWQYRYEVPANITTEAECEQYLNDTIGRNDFAVVSFPAYGKVSHPSGIGLKLVSLSGKIHGVEARFARDYQGYHKAAAGVDAILDGVLALPEGMEDKSLDEEFLNPMGINVIKFVDGNAVLWGDRMLAIDPAGKWKHQRETLSYYENIFLENFNYIVFALNQEKTQKSATTAFLGFFQPEFAKGAITGKSLEDAVVVKIDDENNTAATRGEGDMNAEVGVQIVDTVERFIISVSKLGVTERVSA